ncbi:MAG TPA: glycosyltransferase family 4 protein [Candidatus Dormibacteraeota bacterium]|nr:glycosyltransferase family 4 protein [Candidatus Dormibacteraeota bacterium]
MHDFKRDLHRCHPPAGPALKPSKDRLKIVFVSSNLPRRCGIATFSADLMHAVKAAGSGISCRVAAIDESVEVRPYGPEVRWRIRQGEAENYRVVAEAINRSNADIVSVQHEFGLYGTWTDGVFDDHLRPFLAALTTPVITTLHTVPPDPTPSIRAAIRSAVELSAATVVMADAAARILSTTYEISEAPVVIPHGMPAIQPHGRVRMKEKLGVPGRTIISTFGLVDPRKGIEFMIEAMAQIVEKHPEALYVVAGQTHPELRRHDGESYRNGLVATVRRLGLQNHVSFIDEYMAQREIIELLLASDVYVTPYLDPTQITSGTLAYALGAGKAIVSTPYLHATEALAEGRGVLVPFRDSGALAREVSSLLEHQDRKQAFERAAYEYASDMSWPRTGEHWLALMRLIVASSTSRSHRTAA